MLVLVYLFSFYILTLHLLHGEQWAETGAQVTFCFFTLVLYIGPYVYFILTYLFYIYIVTLYGS